jgi:TPP-dependent pyruvate/acetoin dehydrogenase alpha subunit
MRHLICMVNYHQTQLVISYKLKSSKIRQLGNLPLTKDDLIRFEKEVSDRFERGEIKGPIHLSGGNEDQLIEIFQDIKPTDWVFSTWRSHYHALLHCIPEDKVMSEIMAGRSMNLMFPEYNFFTSAIVGGVLPIAVGVAAALKWQGSGSKVWCFIGDMTATTGIFHETSSFTYSVGLPIKFIVEDNGFSTNSPTIDTWGELSTPKSENPFVLSYEYERTYPHCGIGKFVQF